MYVVLLFFPCARIWFIRKRAKLEHAYTHSLSDWRILSLNAQGHEPGQPRYELGATRILLADRVNAPLEGGDCVLLLLRFTETVSGPRSDVLLPPPPLGDGKKNGNAHAGWARGGVLLCIVGMPPTSCLCRDTQAGQTTVLQC